MNIVRYTSEVSNQYLSLETQFKKKRLFARDFTPFWNKKYLVFLLQVTSVILP
jgi:hypothetical protein